jgi:NAD(P)H-hydrate epimerase
MFLVTANQIQDMDRQTIESFGIPGSVLMENAGRGAAAFLLKRFKDRNLKKIAVMAGPGNNGGDGFVMARLLMEKQIQVTVFLLASRERVRGDARLNMDLFQKLCDRSPASSMVEVPDAKAFNREKNRMLHHDLFIDAIFGTGLKSDVRGFFKDALELMNRSNRGVFAVDISSGLDSDTGRPLGIAVKADATATFACAKAGHILYPGNRYTGDLEIIDIGIPNFIVTEKKPGLWLMEPQEIATLFSPRKFASHKGGYGHLMVTAGSPGKTGAAALCANAAMRCGTGLVTLGIAQSLNAAMEPMVIEPMTLCLAEKEPGILTDECLEGILGALDGKQAVAMGPGMGTREGTKRLVQALVKNSQIPLVLDADALNCIADDPGILRKKKAPIILTPHPGEMAGLCTRTIAEIQADRVNTASEFARDHDVVLVLKGAQTLVAFPDGRCAVCPTGNPGMASGGMGDVLTGMIAGFCAQGFSPESAGLAGVYIHGLCGDILAQEMGGFGFVASDMVQMIPRAIHGHLL